MKRSAVLLAVLTLVAFTVTTVLASVTFTPPDSRKPVQLGSVTLISPKGAPKPGGTASFLRNMEKTKYTMTLQASGLDPKKVYTIWFVKMGKRKDMKDTTMEGIGNPPFTLKVDKKGKAEISYDLKSNPLEKWTTIEIVAHPDKNPKDMKKAVQVLKGDLTKLMS
jgi:hypothetical protein